MILPVIRINTQQLQYSDFGSRQTVSKWGRLIIQQIWKLLQDQWTHISQIKHYEDTLYDINKATILELELTAEHKLVVEKLPHRCKAYFGSNIDSLLETLLTWCKNWYRLIKKARETKQLDQYTIVSS